MPDSKRTKTNPKQQGLSNTRNNNKRYNTFALFPQLPTELRLQIWRHAAFVTRNIALSRREPAYVITFNPVRNDDISITSSYHSTSHPPSLLHTNKESRTEALRWYSLGFGVTYEHRDFTFSTPPRIYINWKTDRVCIQDDSNFLNKQGFEVEEFRQQCNSKNLRSMALNLRNASAATLELCPASLEELIVFDQHPLPRNGIGARYGEFSDALLEDHPVPEYENTTREKRLSWDRLYDEWRERRSWMQGVVHNAWDREQQPGTRNAKLCRELRVEFVRLNFSKKNTA